jgi:hypothetical protein
MQRCHNLEDFLRDLRAQDASSTCTLEHATASLQSASRMLLLTAAELIAFFDGHSIEVPERVSTVLSKLQSGLSDNGEMSPGGTSVGRPAAGKPVSRVRDWLDATPSPGLSAGVLLLTSEQLVHSNEARKRSCK